MKKRIDEINGKFDKLQNDIREMREMIWEDLLTKN